MRALEVGVGKVDVRCWWLVFARLDFEGLGLNFGRGSVAVEETLEF